MKVLFVGLLYNPNKEEEYISHSNVGISVASNLYQWNMIRGLIGNGVDVDVIGSVPYGNYPKLSDVIVEKDAIYEMDGVNLTQIGFINYYFIKHIIRERKLKKYIRKWMDKDKNEKYVIMFYDLQKTFLNVMLWLKRFENVRTCLIVPDLVGHLRNDMGLRGMKAKINNYWGDKIMESATNADSYVFLTKQMNDILNTNNKPYIVIDGIVNDEKDVEINIPDKKVIMYAGNLSSQYRIPYLLSEFEKSKHDNLELWLCGKGDAEDDIIAASKRDKRIKYLGFLSKEQLATVEREVAFYINPRVNNGEYTKYSFPSKNLEYLLAGKPVIAYKLDGMSDEYDDIFMYINESDDSLNEVLEKIANMNNNEIISLAKKGQRFVKGHNGSMIQGKKTVEMIEGLFNESVYRE